MMAGAELEGSDGAIGVALEKTVGFGNLRAAVSTIRCIGYFGMPRDGAEGQPSGVLGQSFD
jgi:hypothetical protein